MRGLSTTSLALTHLPVFKILPRLRPDIRTSRAAIAVRRREPFCAPETLVDQTQTDLALLLSLGTDETSVMNSATTTNLDAYCEQVASQARRASVALRSVSGDAKNRWLLESAKRLRVSVAEILAANDLDVGRADQFGLTTAQVDRLKLDTDRIDSIAQGLEDVAALADPVGEIIDGGVRPNGVEVSRVRVPIGVVFFIYESRPNVTADAAAICVKSGNAVILRGGKEAAESSKAIISLLREAADDCGVPVDAVQRVETIDREAVDRFLGMHDRIDLVIPRGGPGLIQRVMNSATMPVLKHESGICHVYVDAAADMAMAEDIVINSKCQRPGVCNACETLLVHEAIADGFLPIITTRLLAEGIEIRGDEATQGFCSEAKPITPEDDITEYLDRIISVRVVSTLDEAMGHIDRFGSGHTDTIVTEDRAAARAFCQAVDSATVLVNASTRLNDGSQLGLGAEIGISTDRLHARGPCGIRELTTYKYICQGDGQIRD